MNVKLSRMIALAVLAFVLMIATAPSSEGATVSTTIDGAGYNLLDDGTATYTKAPSSTASVTVPSTVTNSGTTYTVTTIGSSAFTKNTTIASVALPSTVTSLPDGCFKNCTNLSSIDLGGVTELSNSCFYGCAFTSFSSESVTALGSMSFGYCASLKSVTLPNAIGIPSKCFQNCTSLETAAFADVGTVYNSAFIGCTSLTTISLPSTTSIEMSAFEGCTELSSLTLGSVATIGNKAFFNCSSLESFDLSSVVSIGHTVFAGTGIPDMMTLGSTLVYVPASFTSVEIPEDIDTIGGGAFYGVTMDSLALPDTICFVNDYGFHYSNIAEISLPDSVDVLGNNAFQKCSSLTSVRLSEGITYLGKSAFNGCSSLTSVDIPENVNFIDESAFSGCSSLTSIALPYLLKAGASSMFNNCTSLESIDLGGVKTFKSSMFSGCTALESFVFPEGSVAANSMFKGCTKLSSVTLSDDMTSIPESMFSGCTALKSIDLKNVTSIGASAFSGTGITELTVPSTITSNGIDRSFQNMASLTKIVLEPSYLVIPYQAFSGCTKLGAIEICGTVNLNVPNAFNNCTKLDTFIIHSEMPFDNVGAFSGTPLKSLVKNDTDNGCTYIEATIVDGDAAASGKILIGVDSTSLLSIDSSYIGVSRAAVSSVLSKSGTFDTDGSFLEVENGSVYADDALLISGGEIRDETAVIMPKSLDGLKSESIISIPGSVTEVRTWALSTADGSSVQTILMYSSPALESASFVLSSDAKVLYLDGAYDEDASGCYPPSGYFIDIDGGQLAFLPNDPLSCEIVAVTDGKSVAFSVIPDEIHDLSVLTVTKNGSSVPKASSGTKINGKDVSGMYICKNLSSSATVVISGLELNTYDITLEACEGVTASILETENIPHGSLVRFSVRAIPGYALGDAFAVTLNGESVSPYSCKEDFWSYSFKMTSDSTISMSGAAANPEVTVSFDSDGGSKVSSQTLLSGQAPEVPLPPVKKGYIFGGWLLDGALYEFGAVEEDVSLVANWLSDSESYAVEFSAEHGQVAAYANGCAIVSGEKVPAGSSVRFVFTPQYGHEATSWSINGDITKTCDDEYVIDGLSGDVVVRVFSQYYATGSIIHTVPFITPTEENYTAEWTFGGGGTVTGMNFSDMTYAPAIMGDYIYCKCDNRLLKVDFDGNLVAEVTTSKSFSGYYEYVAVGNGLILDCYTGKVFDENLVNVFTLTMKDITGYYHDGFFYLTDDSGTGCFLAEDSDPTADGNIQLPVWKRDIGIAITDYRGAAYIVFSDGFMMFEGYGTENTVFMSTVDYKTGEEIDRIYIDDFKGMFTNTGYIEICEGYATMTAYEAGIFDSQGTDSVINIAAVRIDSNGMFDEATLRTASSGTGNGQTSAMIVVDGLGYVFADTTFLVFDMDTMEIIASTENPRFYSHGDMVVSTGYDGKIYAYRTSYSDYTSLFIGVYDVATNTASSQELKNICIQEWCSQQVHFLPDGRIVFVNDAGYLYCIGFQETGFVEDGIKYEIVDRDNAVVDIVGYETAPTGALVIGSTVEHDGATYSVGMVEAKAFYLCKGITSLEIDVDVGQYAFGRCTGIRTLKVTDGVETIEKSGFSGCTGLRYVIISDSVQSIGTNAFYGCSFFEGETKLSTDAESLSGHKFTGNKYSLAMYVPKVGGAISIDGLRYVITDNGEYKTVTLKRSLQELEGIVKVPESIRYLGYDWHVTAVSDKAFYGCAWLTGIDLGSVTTVGYKSFASCKSLEYVNMPCVTTIGDYAFAACKSLSGLNLPSVVTIGPSAFSACTGLTYAAFSDGLKPLGKNSFYKVTFYVDGKAVGRTAANLRGNVFIGEDAKLSLV